jgi:hypothetical protein
MNFLSFLLRMGLVILHDIMQWENFYMITLLLLILLIHRLLRRRKMDKDEICSIQMKKLSLSDEQTNNSCLNSRQTHIMRYILFKVRNILDSGYLINFSLTRIINHKLIKNFMKQTRSQTKKGTGNSSIEEQKPLSDVKPVVLPKQAVLKPSRKAPKQTQPQIGIRKAVLAASMAALACGQWIQGIFNEAETQFFESVYMDNVCQIKTFPLCELDPIEAGNAELETAESVRYIYALLASPYGVTQPRSILWPYGGGISSDFVNSINEKRKKMKIKTEIKVLQGPPMTQELAEVIFAATNMLDDLEAEEFTLCRHLCYECPECTYEEEQEILQKVQKPLKPKESKSLSKKDAKEIADTQLEDQRRLLANMIPEPKKKMISLNGKEEPNLIMEEIKIPEITSNNFKRPNISTPLGPIPTADPRLDEFLTATETYLGTYQEYARNLLERIAVINQDRRSPDYEKDTIEEIADMREGGAIVQVIGKSVTFYLMTVYGKYGEPESVAFTIAGVTTANGTRRIEFRTKFPEPGISNGYNGNWRVVDFQLYERDKWTIYPNSSNWYLQLAAVAGKEFMRTFLEFIKSWAPILFDNYLPMINLNKDYSKSDTMIPPVEKRLNKKSAAKSEISTTITSSKNEIPSNPMTTVATPVKATNDQGPAMDGDAIAKGFAKFFAKMFTS